MIRRPKHGAVHMRPDNATELRHCIGEADSDSSSNGSIQSADAFWPDDRVGGAGAGGGHDKGEVFDDGVGYSDEDYVADYGCGFDCRRDFIRVWMSAGLKGIRTGDSSGPWSDPFPVDHVSDSVEEEEACYVRRLSRLTI